MAEMFLGKRTRYSYARESAYGTAAPATTWSWIGIMQSLTPSSKSEVIPINTMDDVDSRNVSTYFETLRTIGFSMEFLLQHARPLVFAWGSDSLASGANEVHTITETNTLPSFSLNAGYQNVAIGDHATDFTGCVINRMDLTCTKGEFLKVTAEVIGQKSTDHAFRAYQASVVTMKKYPSIGTGSILPYNYSHSDISINGIDYPNVDTLKMSINNNLLAEPVLDSANTKRIAEPIPQVREYEAAFTVKMKSDDLYDLWDAGVEIATDPTVTFTRAAADNIVFTLVDCVLESAISPYNISEGVVLVELPMKVKQIIPVETNALAVDYDTVEA